MSNKPIIVGLGEVLWDMLPSGKQIGGAPFNFTYHTTQLGCEGVMVSCVGDDPLGRELLEGITSLGVDTSLVQIGSHPTGTVDVALDSNGIPQYTIHEGVAWDHIQFTPELHALALRAQAVCWGSLAARNQSTRQTIVQFVESVSEECLKVFDINIRQHYYDKEYIDWALSKANILKLNDDELPLLANYYKLEGEPVEQCRKVAELFGLRYVVYTRGGKDSVIVGEGEMSLIATPRVEVVDTVGAGDSFTASIVSNLVKGESIRTAHQHAVSVAAYVCTCTGGTPTLPQSLIKAEVL